jgi:predicted ester cyclase
MADAPLVTSARPAGRACRPIALVRRLVEEACNGGDLTVLDELLPGSGRMGSAARLRELLPAFRAAVPDARWAIVEQVAAGNTVVTRLEVRGTFAGGLVGLAPPGRPATLSGVAISRFVRGRLVELWVQADLLGFLQQLGVMPPLSLTQAVAMAQVLHAGALLVDERSFAPPDPPPRARAGSGSGRP